MRALLVTHYYAEHGGGIEIVAREMAERLIRRGIEVVWAASLEPANPDEKTVPCIPMKTWNITEHMLGFAYPFWGPIGLARLFQAIRSADVVHLHDSLYMGNVCAYVFARLLRKPVVVTQHVGLVPYSRDWLRSVLECANRTIARLVLGGCDRSIFISMKVLHYFDEFVHFRSPPAFVPNGIATEVFSPVDDLERKRLRLNLGLPSDQPLMLFVGRFVEQKGLLILRSLVDRFPDYHWVFVGWGPIDPASWAAPNVSCPGKLDRARLIPYFQTADLLVRPSVGEGFPTVVQQSMACGTPALISEDTAKGMPGIATVAFLSEVTADKVAEQIQQILESDDLLAARRESVAEYARQHWDWELCMDQYEEMLGRLTGWNAAAGMELTNPDSGGC
jgi:glycosyltransferase involved in cell wall biosynthesis